LIYDAKAAVPAEAPRSLILKVTSPQFLSMESAKRSIMLNQWREGFSYALKPSKRMPTCFYAFYSSWTAECVLVLEDVRARPDGAEGTNMFFGNQIWGVPKIERPVDPVIVLKAAFLEAAEMHAKYWCSPQLLLNPNFKVRVVSVIVCSVLEEFHVIYLWMLGCQMVQWNGPEGMGSRPCFYQGFLGEGNQGERRQGR